MDSTSNENKKEKLFDILNTFRFHVELVKGYRYYILKLSDKNYENTFKISPTFWYITKKAYCHALMSNLSRLFEHGNKSFGIYHLINVCEQNPKFFELPELPDGDRYMKKEEIESFFEGFFSVFNEHEELDTQKTIVIIREKLKNVESIINNLKNQRDKLWAHNDKEFFVEPNKCEDKNKISWEDIDKLISILEYTVTNLLCELGYKTNEIGFNYVDDIDFSLEAIMKQIKENNHGQAENALGE